MRPFVFLALTFALAAPFWAAGALVKTELMPGLPVAGLMFICPGVAALLLRRRESGASAAMALAVRPFDGARIRRWIWFAPILLIQPAITVIAWMSMRLAGAPVPEPRISLALAISLCLVFFIAAAGEEIGWSGYATQPLEARAGALGAALILGAAWAMFHYPALIEAHRSLGWIAGWTLWTFALRIIIVWLFDNTGGSVMAAALHHMTVNLAWQLFPERGSYFDPAVQGAMTALVALVVIALWGPRTLATPLAWRRRG